MSSRRAPAAGTVEALQVGSGVAPEDFHCNPRPRFPSVDDTVPTYGSLRAPSSGTDGASASPSKGTSDSPVPDAPPTLRAVQVRLTSEQHAEVVRIATSEDRSVASWVRQAVEHRLEALRSAIDDEIPSASSHGRSEVVTDANDEQSGANPSALDTCRSMSRRSKYQLRCTLDTVPGSDYCKMHLEHPESIRHESPDQTPQCQALTTKSKYTRQCPNDVDPGVEWCHIHIAQPENRRQRIPDPEAE